MGNSDRLSGGRTRLPAKLSIRKARGAVDRERLFERLDAASPAALIWIQGPAGAGKSTLAAGWVSRRNLPVLWYQVDADDADPATIFSYLAQGASAISRKRRLVLPALTPEFRLDLPGFARRFFRGFFAALPARVVLVFDAAEESRTEALTAVLVAAMSEMSSEARLLATSRDAVPTPLAHLQAAGTLMVIDGEALRLNASEARSLASELPDASLQRLLEATRGWVAGFVLVAAHARRGLIDLPGPTVEQLFPFYLREIYAIADPALRTLLVHTSAMPSFTAAQASRLAATEAEPLLVELVRRHFFIDSSDQVPRVYRYHPLFRQFLRQQAREQLGEDGCRALLLRSAEVLLAAGEDESALALHIEAGARETAAALTCRLAPSLLRQGRIATLGQAIAALPAGTSAWEHGVSFWRGMAALAVAPQRARSDFEAAYAGFAERGDVVGQLQACAATLDALLYGWGDMRDVDAWAERLVDLLALCGDNLPAEAEVRVLSSFAVLIFRGHRHAARIDTACERAHRLLARVEDPSLRLSLAAFLVLIMYLRGQWRSGLRFVELTEPLLPPPSLQPQPAVFWRAMHARLLVWDGQAEAAFAATEQAEAVAVCHNIPALVTLTASAAVFAALNRDDLARAEPWLARMRAGLLPGRRLDAATIDLQHGLVALAHGESARAAVDLRVAVDQAMREGADLLAAQFRLPLALALHMSGAPPMAPEAELQAVSAYADAARTPMLEHGVRMIGAWLALRRGDVGTALERLRIGLSLGSEQGWYVVFPWVPRSLLQDLALLALRHGLGGDHVHELIRRRAVPPPAPDADEWPWRLRVYTLGRFELRIGDRPFVPVHKAPKKPLELLRALVALGGGSNGVAGGALEQDLWPDLDGDASHNALNSALHRLRRLLGDDRAVVLSEGRLHLDPERVWIDADSFERATARAAENDDPETIEALLVRYPGHFLPGDESPWALVARERIRSRFLRVASALADRLQAKGRLEEAIDLARRVTEVDPVAEGLHRVQIHCLHVLGREAEALDAFRRCQALLRTVLGTRPEAATMELARQIGA